MPTYQMGKPTTVKDPKKKQSRSVVMSEAAYEKMKRRLEAMNDVVTAAQDLRGFCTAQHSPTDYQVIDRLVALAKAVDVYDGLNVLPERGEVILSLMDMIHALEQTNTEDDAT